MNKRQGYPTAELAIKGAIEQMEQIKVVGYAQSSVDANLRLEAAGKAMAQAVIKDREMMRELRTKIQVKPLSPEDLASRVYPKRRY